MGFVGICTLPILACLLTGVTAEGRAGGLSADEKETKISGRVLGHAVSIFEISPAGHDGPDVRFLLVLPDPQPKKQQQPDPIRIDYMYFTDEAPLSDSFFDYSKHYAFLISRDRKCDTTVGDFFFMPSLDHSKTSEQRIPLFRPAKSAPELNFDEHLKLSCFSLRPNKYHVLP
jgi:hypothetical protein